MFQTKSHLSPWNSMEPMDFPHSVHIPSMPISGPLSVNQTGDTAGLSASDGGQGQSSTLVVQVHRLDYIDQEFTEYDIYSFCCRGYCHQAARMPRF
jgi:hypothetical protein